MVFLLTVVMSISVWAETLKIGVLSYDPPFVIPADNKNHFFGFDSDLISEVCKRMQVTCQFTPLTIEPLFSQTLDGSIDLALGSIIITEDRMNTFLFSLPYLASKGSFLTRSVNPYNSQDDIRGKRVGTQQGSLFKGLVQEVFNNNISVTEYLTQPLMFQGLSSNDVDAIFLDMYAAHYWAAGSNGLLKPLGESIPIGIGYGIMTNKSNSNLIKRVNVALVSMENDGTYLTLYNRYFLQLN